MSTARRQHVLPAQRTVPAVRITVVDVPGRARVVRLAGEIDSTQRDRLRPALISALQGASRLVIVDLSKVEFCDLTGLNALLWTRRAARAAGAEVVLAGPRPQVMRLLEMSGSDAVFTLRATVDAALPRTGDGERHGP